MITAAISSPSAHLFEDEHLAFRESVRTFMARRVAPEYRGWRRVPRDLLRTAAADGFLGIQVPESAGGLGIDDPRFAAIVAEEAMRAGAPGLALALIGHETAISALAAHGSEELRSCLLPRLASAESLATVVLGDLVLDGPLTGSARFVVQGSDADVFVVVAGGQTGSLSRGADGVTVEPSAAPVGLQPAGLADVHFDGARATPLGSAGELLSELELGLAVSAVSGADAALDITRQYVADRKAFGQPIASFQNTQQMLAKADADLQAGRAFVEACLRERLAGALPRRRSAALKLHCAELYGAVVDACVQLHGGYGYILEYPIAHMYADARFWRLYGTAPTTTPTQREDL